MIDHLYRKAWDAWARTTAPFRASHLPRQRARLDDLRDHDEYALVVLDALRYDIASEVLPQYFDGSLECTWSAAHDTFEYGRRCWGDQVYDDVTYVSGAVPLNSEADDDVFDIDHFNDLYGGWTPASTLPGLVDAWRDCWDDSLGAVPPDTLTAYARDYLNDDQLVVHYLQPHAPYVGRRSLLGHTNSENARPNEGKPVDEPLWDAVKQGETSPEMLRAAYRANVHEVCQHAADLVDDLLEDDRRVVIMADHGELLADHGPRFVSHPRTPHPEIRRVPWMSVTGVTGGPDAAREQGQVTEDVAAKLEALGYA